MMTQYIYENANINDNDTGIYEIFLDYNTGSWTGFYRGSIMITKTRDEWIRRMGNFVQFGGEIKGRETDMPGTLIDPCRFENCKFTKNGFGSQPAQFNSQDNIVITGNNTDEWTILYEDGGSWLHIIDKERLP